MIAFQLHVHFYSIIILRTSYLRTVSSITSTLLSPSNSFCALPQSMAYSLIMVVTYNLMSPLSIAPVSMYRADHLGLDNL